MLYPTREGLSEVNKTYPTTPFTLRVLNHPTKPAMAMTEMMKHSLAAPYDLFNKKEDSTVARCFLTVLVPPPQILPITEKC